MKAFKVVLSFRHGDGEYYTIAENMQEAMSNVENSYIYQIHYHDDDVNTTIKEITYIGEVID